MENKKRNKNKVIWLSVLILLICVIVSILFLTGVLNVFQPNDKGAISLIPDDTSQTDDNSNSSQTAEPPVTDPITNPGIEISDNKKIWNTNTSIEIFKIAYENGEQTITVNAEDNDYIIAPGTNNSYVFKLKNTGDVAIDYTVEIDAYFSNADITIPITARLCRYDGKWILGNKEKYSDVAALDKASDKATVGTGRFTYYTLDWEWPFESGNDEFDTLLGNTATEQDITFTIAIKTIATESENPYDESGLVSPPPQTGDSYNLTLWVTLAICSFIMLIFILFFKKDDDDDEEQRVHAEAEKF